MILAVDLYSILVVLAIIAACVTRPHVLSGDELRIRYGAFFDLRVPLGTISAARVARGFDERGMVRTRDGRLSVAVAAQTIRFYADDPAALTTVLSDVPAAR